MDEEDEGGDRDAGDRRTRTEFDEGDVNGALWHGTIYDKGKGLQIGTTG